MGQTLTHGVYLPSEGERNCYNGLASNWRLLDGAIGTVAAHTTAIAGKASASHTHGNITNDGKVGNVANLPLITGTGGVVQAGAFGNQANTFCEGNDSRLSDARTPVAHTHLTADVTDLLNSDHTWTGTNTFTAANFYHTAENPANILKSSTMQEGVIPSGNRTAYTGYWLDKNANILGYEKFTFYSIGIQSYEVNLRNKATNGSFDPNGSLIQSGYQLVLYPSGNSELKIYAHTLPNGNGTWNLGDSTHKWKTLNGINPGALSLPDTLGASGTENVNYFNVIGYLNNTGTIAIIPTTATYDGWLYINAKDGAGSYITVDDNPSSFGTSVYGNNGLGSQSVGLLCLICPIRAGHLYSVRIKSDGIVSARIYPAQGNV